MYYVALRLSRKTPLSLRMNCSMLFNLPLVSSECTCFNRTKSSLSVSSSSYPNVNSLLSSRNTVIAKPFATA
jgi:hypothetical protein